MSVDRVYDPFPRRLEIIPYSRVDPLGEPSERTPDNLELSFAKKLCFAKLSLRHPGIISLGCIHETFLRTEWRTP